MIPEIKNVMEGDMLYIIRHGQTELNTKMLMQGRSDYPLNETGIAQAEEAAGRLIRIKRFPGTIC